MAKTVKTLITLLTIVLSIFSTQYVTKADNDDTQNYAKYHKTLSPKKLGLKKEKLTHLHFYFHDVVSGKNPTAVPIASAAMTNSSATVFGFLVMMDDPLTVGPDPRSKKIGSAQGLYGSASQTELGLLMAHNYVFTEGKYNGSTLSVLGRNAVFSAVRELPIVGGSGLFRFARGYAQAKTHFLNVTSGDAIVEYNVYVFHY